MKRSLPDKPKGSITWDEGNLEENERIKKELNPRKIDEPKTPYLSPMETDEEAETDGRMSPLALEEAAGPSSAPPAPEAMAAAVAAADASGALQQPPAALVLGAGRGSAWSDSDNATGGSDGTSPHRRQQADGCSPKAGRSPRFSDQYYDSDEDYELEADPERREKRRRFIEARRQHYNVKEQLARAKMLLQQDAEEEEEAGEGEAADEEEQRAAALAAAAAEARLHRQQQGEEEEGEQREGHALNGRLAGLPPGVANGQIG